MGHSKMHSRSKGGRRAAVPNQGPGQPHTPLVDLALNLLLLHAQVLRLARHGHDLAGCLGSGLVPQRALRQVQAGQGGSAGGQRRIASAA